VRKIYLASASKPRKKLFQLFGLKFRVLPANVEELEKSGQLSFPGLVKHNALKKARSAAGRVKTGVVVAADTICVQGNKIFGKPRDLNDARVMLKALSQKPQWLYTGVAVIDKDRKRTEVGFEKTKVYMDKLSDPEISAYFKQVSPLDMAGSFDIQGKGAFFIRRIEGCFYNVVGLPVYKLYRMFRKMGIMFLAAGFCCIFSGCSTEYNIVTGKQDTYVYSTDREVALGQSVAKAVDKEYKAVEDPLVQDRTERIGKKIVAVCDRKDIDYHFKVLDDDEINAVSLPGGYVYVFKGLYEKVSGDDELAAVLAHEVGHVVARHSIKKLQAAMGYSLLTVLVAQIPGSGGVNTAADAAFTELLLGYGREDELLADQLSAKYTKAAGYDPGAMITFLKKLQDVSRRKPPTPHSYFRTHPYVPDRIRIVKQELGQELGFKDYINIQDQPHK
jgi:MAF protein